MRYIFYISFLVLLFTSCNDETNEINSPISSEKTKEDIFLYYDSIGCETPKSIDTLPYYVGRSNKWFINPVKFRTELQPLKKQFYLPLRIDSLSYSLDSSAKIIENYENPIVQPAIIEKIKVKEPKRVKIQEPRYRDNSKMNIQCIGPSEGLITDYVNDIFIDSRGLFWIASLGGLTRYDGTHTKQYTISEGLPDNGLTCINEDNEGNLWLGSDKNGIIKYDGDYFHHYRFDSIITNRSISDIKFDSKGNVWCSIIFGGVLKIDNNEYTFYNRKQGIVDSRPITKLAIDQNNNVYATAYGVGMYRIKNDSLYCYGYPLFNYNHDFLINDDGSIFITPFVTYLSELKNNSLYNYHYEIIPEFGVFSPVKDDYGNYWMTPVNKGLLKWDGNKLQHFNKEDGLPSDNITCITKKGKDLWVGTSDQGIFKFSPNSFKYLTEKDGLPDQIVHKIAQDKEGNYYFATEKGMVIFQDSTILSFFNYVYTVNDIKMEKPYLNGGENFKINGNTRDFVIGDDGILLMAVNNKGLLYLNINKKTILFLGSNIDGPTNPTSITQTKDGVFWIGSHSGGNFYKIENDSMMWYGDKQNFYSIKTNHLMTNHKDEVCIATDDYGVIIMEQNKSFTYYNRSNGLPSPIVNYLYEDENQTLWACTSKGLAYKKVDEQGFKHLKLPEYIPSNNIKAIIKDNKKRYWVTTSDGLVMIKLDNDFKLESHELFNQSKGLINSTFIARSIFIDHSNQLMAGTDYGLMVFALNDYEFQNELPEIFIENIEINGQFINYREDQNLEHGEVTPFYNFPQNLLLNHTQNHIIFNFSFKIKSHFEKIIYEYKLDGFDKDWNTSQESHFAEYKNLDYGKYVFKYRAILPNGIKSEVQIFSFVIKRPWWHTWWARSLYSLLALTLLLALIKWRTAALIKRQKELEKTVEERTIEIVQQKELIEAKHKEITDSINYAERIQRSFLATKELLDENLNEYFVFFKPKDIVSGDFYWTSKLDNGNFAICCADSTGHGVPGAIMSIANIACLKEAVTKGLQKPDEILNETRKLVIEYLKNDGSPEGGRDGMDCSLVVMNQEKTKISFALAQNPIWIVRKGELIEFKPDKMPVGKHDRDIVPFTINNFDVEKGDVIYSLTDGMPDQFGGFKGKKFLYKNLKSLLIDISTKPMVEQEQIIQNTFDAWKGDLEQVDDICIIGVRI